MVLHLRPVENTPDKDVLDTLHHLIREAQAGRITGIAYATIEPGLKFSADIVGDAKKSPVIALGIVTALKAAVSQLVTPLL